MAATFPNVDLRALARDVTALRREEEARLGMADFQHLRRRAWLGRGLTALGVLTAPLGPNPMSMLALAMGSTIRFTIVAHHVMHGALDRVPGVPAHYTSKQFAKGRRRYLDWIDWIVPEAWDLEHNVLHHYSTNEQADPDLVEENLAELDGAPPALRGLLAAVYALSWKLSYYAPSTFQVLSRAAARKRRGEPQNHRADARSDEAYLRAFDPRTAEGRAFWRTNMLPYLTVRFAAPTAIAGLLGPFAAASTLGNLLGAEILCNLHTFLIIASNHAGEDVYRFDTRHRSLGELYLRQIVGSVNFPHGPVKDLLSGYLNYQIEHHLFPDLPPSAYERLAPRVRALCEKHGLPYVQEPVLVRARKLFAIMTGRAKMPRATFETAPANVEVPAPAA